MKPMAPIPGMSLTREPGNAPWEQPPLHETPEKALAYYLEKLDNEDVLDDTLFAVEAGAPIDYLVDILTSYGVMEGYHTVDVKMLISPILHEYLVNLAEAAGIEYVEFLGPSQEERMKQKDEKRTKTLLLKSLGAAPTTPSEENVGEAQQLMSEETEDSTGEDAMEEVSSPLIKRRM